MNELIKPSQRLPLKIEQSLGISVPQVGECKHPNMRILYNQRPVQMFLGTEWQLQWNAKCPDCTFSFRGSAEFIESPASEAKHTLLPKE